MQEVWKDIKNYEGLYQVSNFGNVRNVKTNKILKCSSDKLGYLRVYLYKNKKRKTEMLHRLIASTFIPNPQNKPIINHINGCKNCNEISNLEWVTAKENSIHAVNNNLIKTIPVICVETNEMFKGVNDAERKTGINNGHICKVCKGIRKTAGGFHWKYATEGGIN